MALTLVKEDGTGRGNANSYVDVADGDAYFGGHLYASAWTAATADTKAAALVMATRLIDSQFQFCGFRAHSDQALQWPRTECLDPDRGLVTVSPLQPYLSNFVPYDQVPRAVIHATCEMARELIVVDRTAAPAGEGLSATEGSQDTYDATEGSSSMTSTKYSKEDTRPVISRVAQAMLAKYGTLIQGGSGNVRLVRV
jgi:hypothetical protein